MSRATQRALLALFAGAFLAAGMAASAECRAEAENDVAAAESCDIPGADYPVVRVRATLAGSAAAAALYRDPATCPLWQVECVGEHVFPAGAAHRTLLHRVSGHGFARRVTVANAAWWRFPGGGAVLDLVGADDAENPYGGTRVLCLRERITLTPAPGGRVRIVHEAVRDPQPLFGLGAAVVTARTVEIMLETLANLANSCNGPPTATRRRWTTCPNCPPPSPTSAPASPAARQPAASSAPRSCGQLQGPSRNSHNDPVDPPGGSVPVVTDSDAPLDRKRIYGGEILVFRGLPAVAALAARARAMARAAFDPHAPQAAQQWLAPAQFRASAAALRRSFMRSTEVRGVFRAVIESLGIDPAATCADRLILRLQPSGASHRGRRMRDLPAHRDTWGSNVMAQINLWGPVFPVEPGATMVIWPDLFGQPVPNTSAEWDLERLREDPGRYPLLPECRTPLDDTAAVPVLIEPGDLLCFSGAHLHASRPNRTGRTRLSIDTRIVDRGDALAGRGAANVDGRAPRVVHEWFRGVVDGESLAPRGSTTECRGRL